MKLDAKRVRSGLAVAFVLSGVFLATSGHAAVSPLQVNSGLVYDPNLNVTWAKDANLFKTLAASNSNLVNDIIAWTPNLPNQRWMDLDVTFDYVTGTRALSAVNDFDAADGHLSWFGAQAFVNYLNHIQYEGQTGWRLPTVSPVNGSSHNINGGLATYDGTADYTYNVVSSTGELGYLYARELGNKSTYDTSGAVVNPAIVGVQGGSAGPFSNLKNLFYWSGTGYPNPGSGTEGNAFAFAFGFDNASGLQGFGEKTLLNGHALVLHDGAIQQTPVPLPAGVWLLGSALAGFVTLRKKQQS